MRDYWLTGQLLSIVGLVYLGAAFLCMWAAIRLPKSPIAKILLSAATFVLFGYAPYTEMERRRAAQADYDKRYDKAVALFNSHCKTAGEKIIRTIDDVEGVFLLKIRPDSLNQYNQYELDDPYGHDLGGEAYIHTMLWGKNEEGLAWNNAKEGFTYKYAYARDEKNSNLYRYERGRGINNFGEPEIIRTPVKTLDPRYGVTFDDISTLEDRDNWIAGSSLKVIDLKTKEVIAERVGYMFDPGVGNKDGGRQPWTFATYNACPAFPKLNGNSPFLIGQTRTFVEKVLKPVRKSNN